MTKEEKFLAIAAVDRSPSLFKIAPKTIRDNADAAMIVAEKNPKYFKYVSARLKKDDAFMKKCIYCDGYLLEYASDTLKNDRKTVLLAIETAPCSVEFASEILRNDKKIGMAAVHYNWCAASYLSQRLQDDKDICEEASNNFGQP